MMVGIMPILCDFKGPTQTMLLHGNHGIGKTHIATFIAALRAMKEMDPGVYVKCHDLITSIHFRDTDRWNDRLLDAPLLVVDNIEKENKTSQDYMEQFAGIVERRHTAGLATILICAPGTNTIRDHMPASIIDLVEKTGGIVEFNGPNWRHAK